MFPRLEFEDDSYNSDNRDSRRTQNSALFPRDILMSSRGRMGKVIDGILLFQGPYLRSGSHWTSLLYGRTALACIKEFTRGKRGSALESKNQVELWGMRMRSPFISE